MKLEKYKLGHTDLMGDCIRSNNGGRAQRRPSCPLGEQLQRRTNVGGVLEQYQHRTANKLTHQKF